MDPISITGIAALDAALTGAGVGAVGGLVTGNDPLKGALLGGVTGGGGSLLGLGGGAAGGASQGITGISNVATPAVAGDLSTAALENSVNALSTNLAPNAIGGASVNLGNLGYNATEGANLLGSMGTGITQSANPLMNLTAGGELASGMPTFMDKLANAPSAAFDFMKANPNATLGAGKMFADFKNPPKQQTAKAPAVGVSKGNIGQYQPLLVTEIPKQRYPHSLLLGY